MKCFMLSEKKNMGPNLLSIGYFWTGIWEKNIIFEINTLEFIENEFYGPQFSKGPQHNLSESLGLVQLYFI